MFTGAANALIMSPEIRLFQELTPSGVLGRMFGFRDLLGNAALLGAFLCAGGVLSTLGSRDVFALGGAALLVLAVLAALAFRLDKSAQTPPGLEQGLDLGGLVETAQNALPA